MHAGSATHQHEEGIEVAQLRPANTAAHTGTNPFRLLDGQHLAKYKAYMHTMSELRESSGTAPAGMQQPNLLDDVAGEESSHLDEGSGLARAEGGAGEMENGGVHGSRLGWAAGNVPDAAGA